MKPSRAISDWLSLTNTLYFISNIGFLTLFYTGLLDLAKVFLDPLVSTVKGCSSNLTLVLCWQSIFNI